jgi:glyoxylase-like metal-dependent hydrolase (beta-lactamase superfamily II)
MLIESRAVGPFFKNGFVLGCPRTRDAVVIDPGDEVAELVELVRQHQLSVRHILLTHAHIDHVTGVGPAVAAFDVPVWLHRDDLFLYERAEQQAQMFGLQLPAPLPPIEHFYDGTVFTFGDYRVEAHHTPGHCPGGVCLAVTGPDLPVPHLFVGDTLFAGSIGRTDLPGGDYDVLLRAIIDVLFPLGDDAVVHPGHGPDTTIARERATNPFVLDYLRV